ncbi:MAG: DnaJ family domain-containing protein [Acidimicrobiales bacterium]
MNVFESIADRRIQAAREAGLFNDLPGAGKPIPDLGRERPPGWWGARVVRRERSIARAEQLERDVRAAMPGLWRLDTEEEVRALVDELNEHVDGYNQLTTWERRARLDRDGIAAQWRALRLR